MASTMADNNRVAWTYSDDLAQDWLVSAKKVYVTDVTDGAKYGGSAGAAALRQIPKGLRMRAVKCTAAGNVKRWFVVYDTTCALWATPGTTVTRNLNGVDTVFTSTTTLRAEKRPREGTRDTS